LLSDIRVETACAPAPGALAPPYRTARRMPDDRPGCMGKSTLACLHCCFFLLFFTICEARPALPYPTKKDLSGQEIAEQVYAVTHGRLVHDASSQRNGQEIAMVVSRRPRQGRSGHPPSVSMFEAYSNADPRDPNIDSMQMTIIRSGQARGTGILYISYTDKSRAGQLRVWLPSLRKVRRVTGPAQDDTWFGTNLTYGELVLRRPEHEIHERLEDGVLVGCLPAMKLEPGEINRHTKSLPEPQCEHKGKPVYRIRSTTRFTNWWYDYHISEIDRTTFFLYRTVYYKDGKKLKTVVMDWQSLNQEDPRIGYPRYVYALSHTDGTDTIIFVPRSTVRINQGLPDKFWSESTLKKYGRR